MASTLAGTRIYGDAVITSFEVDFQGLSAQQVEEIQARIDSGNRADAGFTLVEVIAAMVIFLIVSTAAIGMLIVAIRTVRENADRVQAANIARSQVDAMRFLGASAIPKGLILGAPLGTDPRFTVATTSSWAGLNQTTSACDAASPGQAFVRVHVEVSTVSLSSPQILDTLVAPNANVSVDGTGGLTVAIVDQNNARVSGVSVQATDAVHPLDSFTQVTGPDGCIFVPGLEPTGSLSVSVSRSGFVSSTPTGTTKTLTVINSAVTRSTFELAQAAEISFSSTDAEFPFTQGLPVTWQMNNTGASTNTSTIDGSASNIWPNLTGYSSWAYTCADSDPASSSAQRQSFGLLPGATSQASLGGQALKLRGLTANTTVTANYLGNDATCAGSTINLGRSGTTGILKVSVPYGKWSFSAGGQTQTMATAFVPNPDGTPPDSLTVNFTLASLDIPTSSPTPSVSP
jgi:prepilin-type N-terminal cleavage/methylation domain-containing protein